MTLHMVDLSLLLVYACILLGIAWRYARRTSSDEQYLLSARSLTLPAFVMTLVTTWYGAILGVGEFVFGYGVVAWVINGLVWYVVYLFFAFVLAPKIHDSKKLTVADQFRDRIGPWSARIAAGITAIMATPAPYILSLGILLQALFGISLPLAMAIALLGSALYVWHGGFQAVVRTDIVQFLFMFVGFGALVIASVSSFGGLSFLTDNLPATHLTLQGELPLQTIIVWGLLACWTLVDPTMYQRCYAAASGAIAKKGLLWATVFWFLFDMMTLTAGLYARAAFPEADPLFSYLTLADAVLPIGLKGVFLLCLLSIILSTIDSFLFASSSIIATDFLRKKTSASLTKLTKIGIVLTLLLTTVLIAIFESIIGIIYAVGTVGVSALLLPVLLAVLTKQRLSDRSIVFSMLCAGAVAGAWLTEGWLNAAYGWPVYRLGIEPMYVGLLVSAIINCKIFANTKKMH